MRIKEITYDTTDTPWTLDTYSIFTFDRATEMELDYRSDEIGKDLKYSDLEWEFETEEYLKALRDELERLLQEYIIDDVIKSVRLGEVHSPRAYNYTTDGADISLEVDLKELEDYIAENKEDYKENKKKSYDGFMWLGDELETKLDYYLRAESTKKLSKWDAIEYLKLDVHARSFVRSEIKDEVLNVECPHCESELTNVTQIKKTASFFTLDLSTGDTDHMFDQAVCEKPVHICPECDSELDQEEVTQLQTIASYKQDK